MFTAEKKIRVRDAFRVGASVASIWALTLTVTDTPTQTKDIFLSFCRYPTLCVWGKHSAWTSTAEIGGVAIAHYIGQKPGGIAAPTLLLLLCKGMFTKVKVIYWEERKQKRLRFG